MSQESEKLKRELKFIEDSFQSGIISKSEYESAKERVQQKLSEVKEEEPEPVKEQPKQEIRPTTVPAGPKLETYHDEEKIDEGPKDKPESSKKEPAVKETIQKEDDSSKLKLETYGKSHVKVSRTSKYLIIAAIILILVVVFFSLRGTGPQDSSQTQVELPEETFTPVCSADLDCQKTGFVGICLNPGTKEADCSFEEANPLTITIITSEDCTLCDTSRMRGSLKQIYPAARFRTLDKLDSEAKELLDDLDIKVLPAYIFDEDLEDTARFQKTQQTFEKVGDLYLMKPSASGSNFFLDNPDISEKVDLFMDPFSTTSQIAYENLLGLSELQDLRYDIYFVSRGDMDELKKQVCVREVLDLESYLECFFDEGEDCLTETQEARIGDCFEDDAESYLEQDKEKAEEFFINTAPVFILNNQFKKGGSLSVDILEEFYCEVNDCRS